MSETQVLEKCPDAPSVQDFCERIQGEIERSVDNAAHKLIVGIASVLGINPGEAPEQTDALSDGEVSEDDSSKEQELKEE